MVLLLVLFAIMYDTVMGPCSVIEAEHFYLCCFYSSLASLGLPIPLAEVRLKLNASS